MHQENGRVGVALICDQEGIVQHVVRDEVGVVGWEAGRPFTLLVDRGSMTKALSFLVKLRTERAAFGWEINVPAAGTTVTLHFAGGRLTDRLLIVGALNDGEMMELFKELMRSAMLNLIAPWHLPKRSCCNCSVGHPYRSWQMPVRSSRCSII